MRLFLECFFLYIFQIYYVSDDLILFLMRFSFTKYYFELNYKSFNYTKYVDVS